MGRGRTTPPTDSQIPDRPLPRGGTAVSRVSPPPTPPHNVADLSDCVMAGSIAATLQGGGNAVNHFDARRLVSTWLFTPRKCARSRSERPRTAKTDLKNPYSFTPHAKRLRHSASPAIAMTASRTAEGSGTACVPPPTTAATKGSTSKPLTSVSSFMSAST